MAAWSRALMHGRVDGRAALAGMRRCTDAWMHGWTGAGTQGRTDERVFGTSGSTTHAVRSA
eukprot:12092177-Alexandrium_andersonii.AAC.1